MDLWTFGLNPSIQGDTFANRLRVIPVRIPRADALDDRGALLQGVAGVAGELNHSSDTVERVGGGEVAVLEVRLVAVAALKSCRRKRGERQDTMFAATMTMLVMILFVILCVILAETFRSFCLKNRHKST